MTQHITPDFIKNFLSLTEEKWANAIIDETIFGFQFQKDTKWNPGLSPQEITAYQSALGVQFPTDLVTFLQYANGTDLPTINIYGNNGDPHVYAPGIYSYPRDLEIIRQCISWVKESWEEASESLNLPKEKLGDSPAFIPFYKHRYILSNGNIDDSIVCSIYGADAIVYSPNLKEYLEKEFLEK